MSPRSDFFERLNGLIQGQDSSLESSLRSTLGTPTISVALLSSSSIKAHCFSLPECPANEQTLFQACSISKPVAAVATFRAIQAGHLSLHDPITKYLDAGQISLLTRGGNTRELLHHVTYSHLLSHTSGLSQHGFDGYRHSPYPSTAEIIAGMLPSNSAQVYLQDFPGREVNYSGGGYTVLQLALENIFRKPFSEVVQELVFDPLEMHNSRYSLDPNKAEDNKMYYAPAYETGHLPAVPPYHIFPEQAAAGVWTTPSDLQRLVSVVQKSASGMNEEFLRQDLALQMLEDVPSGRAHGWKAPKGMNIFAHAGANAPGYHCFVLGFVNRKGSSNAALPKSADGIAIMTNSALGWDTVGKVFHAAAYLLDWDFDEVNEVAPGAEMPFPIPDAQPPPGWEGWSGTWYEYEPKKPEGTKKAKFTISTIEGNPVVSFESLPPTRLLLAAVGPAKVSKGPWHQLLVQGLELLFVLHIDDDGQRAILMKRDIDSDGTKLIR